MSKRFRSLAGSRPIVWSILSYLLVLLAVAALTSVAQLLRSELIAPSFGVFYLIFVLAVAYWLGSGQALLATILSLLAIDYYFAVPLRSFLVFDARDVARLVLLAVASFAGILLTHMIRGRERSALALADANARLYREAMTASAEARRHLSELNALLENLVEGVTVVDGAGRVLLFNETGKTIWRAPEPPEAWTEEWLVSRDMRYPDGRPMPVVDWPLSRALRGERFSGYEVLHIDPEGRHHQLVFSGSAVHDERGEVVMAINVYQDMTQIRELERVKDEFLEVAAHELKTPVAVLKGYAQVLQRAIGDVPDPYRKSLAAIDRQVTRIDALVRDLLDVARLRAGTLALQRDVIDITELAEGAADQAALRSQRHKIKLVTPGPLFVMGDRARLEQVLSRLLDNAVRYSPKGGDVEVNVSRDDGAVRVAVCDRGVGIAPEKQAHIFERFYRAHTGTPYDYGGMGVGLYIAREIIRSHKGDIGFSSRVDEGSTFYFTIPLVKESNGPSVSGATPS